MDRDGQAAGASRVDGFHHSHPEAAGPEHEAAARGDGRSGGFADGGIRHGFEDDEILEAAPENPAVPWAAVRTGPADYEFHSEDDWTYRYEGGAIVSLTAPTGRMLEFATEGLMDGVEALDLPVKEAGRRLPQGGLVSIGVPEIERGGEAGVEEVGGAAVGAESPGGLRAEWALPGRVLGEEPDGFDPEVLEHLHLPGRVRTAPVRSATRKMFWGSFSRRRIEK